MLETRALIGYWPIYALHWERHLVGTSLKTSHFELYNLYFEYLAKFTWLVTKYFHSITQNDSVESDEVSLSNKLFSYLLCGFYYNL